MTPPPASPPTLSLTMIVKDEEGLLGECLDAVRPYVQEIVIVDTGSTDRTREIARERGAIVFDVNPVSHPHLYFLDDERTGAPPPYSGKHCLGDFGGARQVALDLATSDYVMWLDADDVLEGAQNLPRLVADLARTGAETAWFQYLYGHDEAGRCICKLWRERVVRRGTAKWENPIHEIMAPQNPASQVQVTDIVVRHRRPPARDGLVPRRNYKVLIQQIRKTPSDARTLFYLANEAQHIDQEKAIAAYERYVEVSGWADERVVARITLGGIYESRGLLGRAFACYSAATTDAPNMPDGWYALARLAYGRKDWASCCRFTEEGIKRGNPDTVIMINPMSRTYVPHLFYNVALNHLGRVAEALESVRAGLAVVPEDPTMRHNMFEFQKYLDERAVQTPLVKEAVGVALGVPGVKHPPVPASDDLLERMALRIWKELVNRGERAKASALLDALPATIADLPVMGEARAMLRDLRVATCDPIGAGAVHVLTALRAVGVDVPDKMMCVSPLTEEAAALGNLTDAKVTHVNLVSGRRMWDGDHYPVVAVVGMLEKVDDVRSFLADAWDAIGYGGHLVVVARTPAVDKEWMTASADVRRFSAPQLRATLEAAGFTVEEVHLTGPGGDVVAVARPQRIRREKMLDVVFWAGPAVEQWTPLSPSTSGIGGSETAMIEVARHLAGMGHAVTVYSDCGDGEGIYAGVEYRRHQRWTQVKCDVFVASRQPSAVDQVEARVKLLWVHDVHVGHPDPNVHRWLLRYDRVLCLSRWHKALLLNVYPHVHPDKVVVTRNGLDPDRFTYDLEPCLAGEGAPADPGDIAMVPVAPKRKNRLIFSSSANRGLDALLDMMPAIRAQVPDAELHVFYGFESWEATARRFNLAGELAQIEGYRKRLAETPGVVFRGRVDQRTLAREMMEAKVWAYPTAFTETYCIGALEAQAAGCVPITSNLAGVAETALWGVRLPGSNNDPNYRGEFVHQVALMLTDEERRGACAAAGRKWALTQTWAALAIEWAAMFGMLIDELKWDPVPRYSTMMGKAA